LPPTPRSTLFPYTTLFRSVRLVSAKAARGKIWLVAHRPRDFDNVLARGRVHGVVEVGKRAGHRRNGKPCGASDLFEGHRHGSLRSEEHTSELQSRENLVCR